MTDGLRHVVASWHRLAWPTRVVDIDSFTNAMVGWTADELDHAFDQWQQNNTRPPTPADLNAQRRGDIADHADEPLVDKATGLAHIEQARAALHRSAQLSPH